MTEDSCDFCELPTELVIERDGPCIAIWTNEPPEGSVMVLPVAHRLAPWDLSAEEWAATQRLLRELRQRVDRLHAPQGWNVGWNIGEVGGQSVAHAHCHLIPRHADEPYAGRGLRWWFKQPENARRPGGGRRTVGP